MLRSILSIFSSRSSEGIRNPRVEIAEESWLTAEKTKILNLQEVKVRECKTLSDVIKIEEIAGNRGENFMEGYERQADNFESKGLPSFRIHAS